MFVLRKGREILSGEPLLYIRIKFKLRHSSHLLSYVSPRALSHFVASIPILQPYFSLCSTSRYVHSGWNPLDIAYPCSLSALGCYRFEVQQPATYKWKPPRQPSDHPLLQLTLCSITSKAISSPCVFSIASLMLTFYYWTLVFLRRWNYISRRR